MKDSTTIAILAGGQSSRMGSDKSFVLLRGRPLLQHIIDRVGALQLPTILIANDSASYQSFGLPVFPDVLADKGSLGGIYTALRASQSTSTLCVACDMPFLNPALVRYLSTLRDDVDAVVPRIDDRPQGLHAFYHHACLPIMRQALEQDRLKIKDFLKQIRVRYVEENELRQFDPTLKSFTNVNTPEELERAERL